MIFFDWEKKNRFVKFPGRKLQIRGTLKIKKKKINITENKVVVR